MSKAKSRDDRTTYRGLRLDPAHSWRAQNLGRLLMIALDQWQSQFVAGLHDAGFTRITTVHMNLMRHVDLDGTRLSELAERVGTTKQAVGQLVKTCAGLGLVHTVPDRTDGRAKIVHFTQYGRDAMLAGQQVIELLDAETDRQLGRELHRSLRVALDRVGSMSISGEQCTEALLL